MKKPPTKPSQAKPSAPVQSETLPKPSTPPPQPDPHQPSKRQRQIQERYALLTRFHERWPQTFPQDVRLVKPFALGIHKEIIQALPDTNPYLIRRTIHFYQRGGKGAYWRAVLQGGSRYNLDGEPQGEVTDKDKEHAQQELAAMAAWWKAKRAGRPLATAAKEPGYLSKS